ncbi:Fe-S protein assembly co-chaperone HscB [Thioalkalivibrio denitrificans]|nr:Fe-S protein assembly co-chaperone HscB [Thioalkalivibrio denitrificans]
MDLDFSRNHFELMGLPVAFDIDRAALDEAYRQLQGKLHPDRYAQAGDQERRLAMQGSAWVNEAYATLKDDTRRARYLLTLHGVAFDEERDTADDPAFLMEQMELREALEEAPAEADPLGRLDSLSADINARRQGLSDQLSESLDAGRLDEAKALVLKMRFYDKLRDEARRTAERLEDELP